MKALFDTNILIDYLNGVAKAKSELAQYESRAISPITWMEVMAGCEAAYEPKTRAFLASFTLVPIDADVAERTVKLRRQSATSRMKLPDAIILASAIAYGGVLVTRNSKEFDAKLPIVRIPYVLK